MCMSVPCDMYELLVASYLPIVHFVLASTTAFPADCKSTYVDVYVYCMGDACLLDQHLRNILVITIIYM